MNINKLLQKPKIVAIVADTNAGKSNFLYYILTKLNKSYNFNLYTYGLKYKFGVEIHSVEELEQIKDSLIVIDEYFTLFDLEDRRKRKLIEKTLRLIYHNNNVLILSGLCENFKKFISNKLNIIFFMKCTLGDFINGGRMKRICLSYKGTELGSSVLNLGKGESIIYDGLHYEKIKIPYLPEFDSKKNNKEILSKK